MRITTIEEDDEEMNLAPMIDIVFLLLIYFLVTSTLIREEADLGVLLPAQVDQDEPLEMPDEIIIDILANGQVLLNNQPFDGPDSRRMTDLKNTLNRFRQAADSAGVKAIVTIQSEDEARHQRIIDVLNACAEANIQNVSFGLGN